MKTLIAILHREDPTQVGLVTHLEPPGPILSVLQYSPFEKLFLIAGNQDQDRLETVTKEIRRRHQSLAIETETWSRSAEDDPLEVLRSELPDILNQCRVSEVSFCGGFGLSHWLIAALLLQGEGEGRFHALYVRRPNSTNYMGPVVSRVSLPQTVEPANRVAELGTPFVDDLAKDFGLVGKSLAFQGIIENVASLAETHEAVLLQGAPGTGRESLARLLHRLSEERYGPFVVGVGAALRGNSAIQSLFGSSSGDRQAFHTPMVQKARGGTLFLRDAHLLSHEVQCQLRQLLSEPHKRDLRLILAVPDTVEVAPEDSSDIPGRVILLQEDLKVEEDAPQPTLCAELMSALGNVIKVPSLRERQEDIPVIALHYPEQLNRGLRTPKKFHPTALSFLETLPFVGNLPELRAILERTVLLSRRTILQPDDLSKAGTFLDVLQQEDFPLPDLEAGFALEGFLSDLRRRIIFKALDQARGNQSEAARLLKVTPQAVHQFLKQQKSQYGQRETLDPDLVE